MGTVRPRHIVVLSFKTVGRIARVLVEEGEEVRAGQLLAELDPTERAAESAAARAELVRAQAEATRLRRLLDQGWVTRARVEAADAALEVARARADASMFDLNLTRIVAPSGGRVLMRQGELGQIAAPGTPIITLAEARGGWVLAVPVNDQDVGLIQPGQRYDVQVPGLPGPVSARIVEIAAQSDAGSGLFDAELALPPHPVLRSGLIGSAALPTPAPTDGLLVPPMAIFDARADEGFVFVVEAGRARRRKVGLAGFSSAGTAIASGVQRGEQVIVSGVERLRDGAAVRVRGRS